MRNEPMAWRIEGSVVRGEIDNRKKGVVEGKLWVHGIAEPVVLELTGNACGDLAGCLLNFKNPQPTVPMRRDATLSPLQRGRIGDLTASKKVRVFDIPGAEPYALIERGDPPPEHMANSLYLEWFSDTNGRVVIESIDFELEISPPEWRMTAEEEKQRLADASAGWRGFLGGFNGAIERLQRRAKDPEAEWDEHDFERFLKESDARTSKYIELLDKYGTSDEARPKIDQEMGWTREVTSGQAEEDWRIEEMNAACEGALNEPLPEPDPVREGIDWIRSEEGEIRHPLQHRCFEAAIKIHRQFKELGLSDTKDDDAVAFLFEFEITGAKLAGALNGIAEGYEPSDPAFTVACLKRALDHLHKSQSALEAVASKQRRENCGDPILPDLLVEEARRELFEIREGILRLMQEHRDRK